MGGTVCRPKDGVEKIFQFREINGASLARYSAGIENASDLGADLEQGLEQAAAHLDLSMS